MPKVFAELNFKRGGVKYCLVKVADGYAIECSNGDRVAFDDHADGVVAALLAAAETYADFAEIWHMAFFKFPPNQKLLKEPLILMCGVHAYRISRYAPTKTSVRRDDGVTFVSGHIGGQPLEDTAHDMALWMEEIVAILRAVAKRIQSRQLKLYPSGYLTEHTLEEDK
jgi:hypothetical protein